MLTLTLTLADRFLDTPMCSAHTTACDVLWGGTPVLALPAERMSSRLAASALVAAGLPELVTSSLEAYEELAVGLALDVDDSILVTELGNHTVRRVTMAGLVSTVAAFREQLRENLVRL